MIEYSFSTWGKRAAMGFLSLLLAGCGVLFPPAAMATPSFTSTTTSTPTPTQIPAKIFMKSVGSNANDYPVRYSSTGGEISFDVPAGWVSDREKESDLAEDSIAGSFDGEIVMSVYRVKGIENEENARQAAETFLDSKAMADRNLQINDQAAITLKSGEEAWKIQGAILSEGGGGVKEDCILLVTIKEEAAFALLAYPSRDSSPEHLQTQLEKAFLSLQWEETQPVKVDKNHELQLTSSEPSSLDPAITNDGVEGVIGDIYSGLVAMDPSLQVQPALAERWDVAPDGKTYTFHMRRNAKFQNGRPVTAEDVLYSWLRAASPEVKSDTVLLYMGDIVGLREYNAGEADAVSGIHVVDPMTIQVTIDGPENSFLDKLTAPVSWIVDRYQVVIGNWEMYPNGTGPFRMLQRIPQKSMLLEANPNYYGAPPEVRHIYYRTSYDDIPSLYKNGNVDTMIVPSSSLPNANDPHDPLYGSVNTEQRLCTSFITLDNSLPPFDDPLVRKAFELSIRRDIYVEVSPEEGDLPAYGILPPGMPGYSADWKPTMYDPDEAKNLLRQSHYYKGSGSPPKITFTVISEDAYYSPDLEFIVHSLKNSLGVDILVEGISQAEFYRRISDKNYGQLHMDGWCANFPDPENFYDFLFHSNSPRNYSHYSNSNVDDLLESARVEPEWNRRVSIYRQIDQILYDEAPIILLSYSGPRYIVWKPYVLGYESTLVGIPQHHRMAIEK